MLSRNTEYNCLLEVLQMLRWVEIWLEELPIPERIPDYVDPGFLLIEAYISIMLLV